MIFVGPGPLKVIVDRIIIPTPIISRVSAYPRKEPDGSYYLAIHIVSDCGKKDTVIPKLCERAREVFSEAYATEHVPKLEKFAWVHSGVEEKIPAKAQVLYLRKLMSWERPDKKEKAKS